MKILLVIVWLLFISTAQAASFDCKKAETNIEKLICDDATLSKLDEEVAKAYQDNLEQSYDQRKTVKDQRQWLKEVRNVCQDAECVKTAISLRISQLKLVEGSWCTHPCYYGSTHRPGDLPCQLDIDSNIIRWRIGKARLERPYKLKDIGNHSATLIIDGGTNFDWYASPSMPDSQWEVVLESNHGNEFAKDSLYLSSKRYCGDDKATCKAGGGSSFFIFKRKEKQQCS